jgi:hypothetical protein
VTRSELITKRDALIAALAGGVKTVRDQNGEMVVYQDAAQMQAVLKTLDAELRRLSGPQPNAIIVRTSKGLF